MAALSSDAQATYAAGLAQTLASQGGSSPLLALARKDAFAAFVKQGWPTTKQEDWRFTDVSRLTRLTLLPAPAVPVVGGGVFPTNLVDLGRGFGHRMSFLDGRHDPSLPTWLPPPRETILAPLSSVVRDDPKQVEGFPGQILRGDNAFVSLNTAFHTDGAFVRIPAGLAVEAPILLVFRASAEGSASFPRTLVWAGRDSQATVFEMHLGADGRVTCSNAVTEILLDPGAHLAYHSMQKPSSQGFHVGHLAVTQKAGSTLFAHNVSLDGRLVRNDAHVLLAEENCTCQLDGIYLAAGGSHIDNNTCIDHRAPRCTSREQYKGVVAERGQAVWTGRAIVRPGAQGTDARQTNRNLILDDGAVVHAKPHLEIFANDVKCSHGATTGRLDPEALFYLRSRGIGDNEANQILISAFLREGLARVANAPLRGELEAILAERTRELAREGASP